MISACTRGSLEHAQRHVERGHAPITTDRNRSGNAFGAATFTVLFSTHLRRFIANRIRNPLRAEYWIAPESAHCRYFQLTDCRELFIVFLKWLNSKNGAEDAFD